MDSENFNELYERQVDDLEVVVFKDANGISIVKKYPEKSKLNKDQSLMFIRLYLSNDFVCGGIERVKQDKKNKKRYHLVTSNLKSKRMVTNFAFNEEENFTFNKDKKKIYDKNEKSVTINKFVEILVKNHVKDKFILKIKRLRTSVVNRLLEILFWLVERKYTAEMFFFSINEINKKSSVLEKLVKDPLFRYFKISRNILLVFSIVLIPFLFFIQYKKLMNSNLFNVANPLLLFSCLISFFLCEKVTLLLDNKIREFSDENEEKRNFISKLYYIQFKHSFKLKL